MMLENIASIFKNISGGKKYNRELTSHSLFSALFTSWFTAVSFNDSSLTAFAFYSVYKHHSDLKDKVEDVFDKSFLNKIIENYNYKEQFESISRSKAIVSTELAELLKDGNSYVIMDSFFKEYEAGFPILKDSIVNFVTRKPNFLKDYYQLLLFFSLLIDSDKKEASHYKSKDRLEVDSSSVDKYLSTMKKTDSLINKIRQDIYQSANSKLIELAKEKELPKILTITAPTGTGKTLLSFSLALKLRNLIKERQGLTPRIIYILPYINIIDQTYDVFNNVLDSGGNLELLLKHHHLLFGSLEPNENRSLEDITLLAESWDSEVIVTTFVQLFETLFGTKNRMLKKFHKFFNSIIIFDEIQTLPIEYWKLVKEALQTLVEQTNSYIIYMSATRPIIFSGNELIDNWRKNFSMLNRVRFRYISKKFSVGQAVEFVSNEWNRSGSLLVVLNTIDSSIEFYNRIKDLLRKDGLAFQALNNKDINEDYDKEKIIVGYLSTNLLPIHRKKRIDQIRELLKKDTKLILVSTQVVEAGVDLDFDMAIRDIGPFDSIVQVAGRCNRNGLKDKGKFYVLNLVDENGKLYANNIYERLAVKVSRQIFESEEEFDESTILNKINDYYLKSTAFLGEESDEYREAKEAIEQLDFAKLNSIRLIKNEPKFNAFIEYDEEAFKIKEELLKLIDERKNPTEQKNTTKMYEINLKVRKKRAELENYIISTWKNIEHLPLMLEFPDLKYINTDLINQYYDDEVGLKLNEPMDIE